MSKCPAHIDSVGPDIYREGVPNHFLKELREDQPLAWYGVIVKSGVFAFELGCDLVNGFHLDAIVEFNPGNHLCQMFETA